MLKVPNEQQNHATKHKLIKYFSRWRATESRKRHHLWVEIDVSPRPYSDSFFFAFSRFHNILKLQLGLERFKQNQIDIDVLTCKAGVFCSVNDDATRPNFLLVSTSKMAEEHLSR